MLLLSSRRVMSVLRGVLFIYFDAAQEVEQRLMIHTCNNNKDSIHSFMQRHFFPPIQLVLQQFSKRADKVLYSLANDKILTTVEWHSS